MKKFTLFALGILLLLAVPACSGDKPADKNATAPAAEAKAPEAPMANATEHAMTNATGGGAFVAPEAPMVNATAPAMSNATTMDHGGDMGLEALKNNYSDQIFLSMMLPHHSAAVAMCKEILKTTTDPQIKAWAEEMDKVQRDEIVNMLPWLEAVGRKDETSWNNMSEGMKAMREKTLSDNSDADFVLKMIEHHQLAVDMAKEAEARSKDPKVVELAKNIVTKQSEEIKAMQGWLDEHKIPYAAPAQQ